MKPEEAFPSLCGKFLIAMPGMGDSRFERSVIYICAHSPEGAMGFIVNRTMDSPTVLEFLEQLEIIAEAEKDKIPIELSAGLMHVGGPVEPGRGFVLHTSDFESSSTVEVRENVSLTATLEILRAIAVGKGPEKTILALGYSGW
ncbi:MAG: YqgE/AlgH family protein, partial [Pseudomonadota bacterium]